MLEATALLSVVVLFVFSVLLIREIKRLSLSKDSQALDLIREIQNSVKLALVDNQRKLDSLLESRRKLNEAAGKVLRSPATVTPINVGNRRVRQAREPQDPNSGSQ